MVIKGLRKIGKFMGVSPMTILRWHRECDDLSLSFPLVPRFTGVGFGVRYMTDTGLILLWMKRLSGKDWHEQKTNLKRPRKRKMLQMGVTQELINKLGQLAKQSS